MGDKLTKGLIFVAGVITGSAASLYYFKKKYENIADDEIEKVRELYKKKLDKLNDEEPNEEPEIVEETSKITNSDKEEYSKVVDDLGYNGEGGGDLKLPYIIDQDEYGEIADYELVTLTYYADERLEDENGRLVEDIDYLIGWDSLDEFEDGVVFVRNDELKKDFEIMQVDQKYYED